MAKAQIREQIAEGISVEKIQGILDKCMDGTDYMSFVCSNPNCRKSQKHQVFDAKTAMDAAKWAVEQGYGRVPNAKPVDEIDFSQRDPLAMSSGERGQLRDKVLAAIEGKA